MSIKNIIFLQHLKFLLKYIIFLYIIAYCVISSGFQTQFKLYLRMFCFIFFSHWSILTFQPLKYLSLFCYHRVGFSSVSVV